MATALDRTVARLQVALVAVVWLSGLLFGVYIVAFYVAAWAGGDLARWNDGLPNLHGSEGAANAGIGLHFATGALLLVLGSVQFVGGLRRRAPAVHRAIGVAYVLAAAATALGGLTFIAVRGTIGGLVMDVAFAGYGLAMLVSAGQTFRHGLARRLPQHRAWAMRLYALAIGSWLYRMGYGLWFGAFGTAGHTDAFDGPLDYAMDFAFYVPALIVVELLLRSRRERSPAWMRAGAAAGLALGVFVVGFATYFFLQISWYPEIARFFGLPLG
jgi:uncharacterized membrane protein